MSLQVRPCGEVFGNAGYGLSRDTSWAASGVGGVAAGLSGELRTAELLNRLCLRPGGPSVIHDLRIPLKGIRANIDHAVVAGDRLLLIDSKVWRPGVYWTVCGQSRRGLERFRPAEKKTMRMAFQAIDGMLRGERVRAELLVPVLVVWPSNDRAAFRPVHFQVPGARVIGGAGLERLVRRMARTANGQQANPAMMDRLLKLANGAQPTGRY